MTKLTYRLILIILSLCLIYLLLYQCSSKEDDEGKTSNTISTGAVTSLSTTSVSSSGGTITITDTISGLKGMQIRIPAGSYSSGTSYSVSYAPITSHKLGENFNPITPMITISNGGGFSDSIMTVTIPITLDSGEFAIAFAYNPSTGKLEGLPVIGYQNNQLTIGTRHFAHSETAGTSGQLKKVFVNPYTSMVISSIKESVLATKTIIASEFTPGIDDWEFVNLGSWIALGGHCAGQSMTAMWYYYVHQLAGEPQLFRLLDDQADLWQDNPLGYKLASTIQNDFNFDGWITSLTLQSYLDPIIFKTFAASILLTGEPQSVLIRNSAGQGGHAMIVYKVDYSGGKLYIADPNYPGNIKWDTKVQSIRIIEFSNGKFTPYPSGLNAASSEILFDQIGYSGKTSYINWDQIDTRWQEVKNKTIGNDRFPDCLCSLKVKNEIQWKAITLDTILINQDTITLKCWVKVKTGNSGSGEIEVYRGSTKIAGKSTEVKWKATPGSDRLGVYITSMVNAKETWIDFKHLVFIYGTLSIEPEQATVAKNTKLGFTARPWGTAPNQSRYEWDFGDGTAKTIIKNDSTVEHTYQNAGSFTIKLKLYDDQSNTLHSQTEAYVQVLSGDLIITSITPSPANPGDTLTILGFGFGQGSNGYGYIHFTDPSTGEGTMFFASNSQYIKNWTDTEIKIPVLGISSGPIYVRIVYPQTIESNRVSLQIRPKIQSVDAYNTGSVRENRSWPGGPSITIYGSALKSFTSGGIVSIGSTNLPISSNSYHLIHLDSIPTTTQSGNLTVTVDGISSTAIPFKIGVEDWAQMSTYFDLDFTTEGTVKCAKTGEIKDWSIKPFDYSFYGGIPSITWSGNNFSLDFTGVNRWIVLKLTGTINNDGTRLQNLTYYKETFSNDSSFTIWEIDAADLPLTTAHYYGSVYYSLQGAELATHITKLKYREVYTDYLGLRDWNIESVKYTANSSMNTELSVK